MKKLLLMLMSIIMLIAFVGCGEETESGDENDSLVTDTLIADESESPDVFESPDGTAVNSAVTSATSANTPGATAKPTATAKPAATSKPATTTASKVTATVKPTATKTATAKPTATKAPTSTPTATSSVKLPSSSTQVGDIVKYGKYEQDNNTSNGKEEIEWIVLAKENNRILVISKYALDYQPYYTSFTNITWENCTLRTWLNNTFINNAFSSAEKSRIPTVTVTAEDNLLYGTEAGNNTQDKVFLLSISEANKYFSSSSSRMCYATSYAKAQDAGKGSIYGTCWWWLRSPGYNPIHAADVNYDGGVRSRGNYVLNYVTGVRPALWIELSE